VIDENPAVAPVAEQAPPSPLSPGGVFSQLEVFISKSPNRCKSKYPFSSRSSIPSPRPCQGHRRWERPPAGFPGVAIIAETPAPRGTFGRTITKQVLIVSSSYPITSGSPPVFSIASRERSVSGLSFSLFSIADQESPRAFRGFSRISPLRFPTIQHSSRPSSHPIRRAVHGRRWTRRQSQSGRAIGTASCPPYLLNIVGNHTCRQLTEQI
jgi:hypothetical protein